MFTLPRAAGFAAALCTALALTTPAFALDVQIQEGAAVKFPNGLEWEPMVRTEIYKVGGKTEIRSLPTDSPHKKEQKLAASFWKVEMGEIISKLIKSGKTFYFITALYEDACGHVDREPESEDILHCKAKIVVSRDAKFTSAVTIDSGTICATAGDEGDESVGGLRSPYIFLHPEIAFDAKNNSFYLRQLSGGEVVRQCNRKITLTP